MIIVTQGHEKGIGLEVFLKALSLAPSNWLPELCLVAHRPTLEKHIRILGLSMSIEGDVLRFPNGSLRCSWIKTSPRLPLSSVAMEVALTHVGDARRNVLFTLPTTKDDLRNPQKPRERYLGHTEYLRSRAKSPELGMFFSSSNLNVLLLTDHVPLREVHKQLTPSLFSKKLTTSLRALNVLEPQLRHGLIAGINPHAGEAGLLGKEELKLLPALKKIKIPRIRLSGFYPGDTLVQQKRSSAEFLIYTHHDQGLAPFKALMGTLGANITLGLPFVRLSVDHGTAFALYGKNMADHRGAFYCLRKAIGYQELMSGKDSDHKSTRSQS